MRAQTTAATVAPRYSRSAANEPNRQARSVLRPIASARSRFVGGRVNSFTRCLTPELSRPAKRVRLERTVMRAKVNPKPTARNGHAIHGSTEKRPVSTEEVEAGKGRSRERRKSVSHEAILCRAARTRCVPSRLKRSRGARANRTDQRAINAEVCDAVGVAEPPKPTTPTHLPTHNTGIKPTREAGSA